MFQEVLTCHFISDFSAKITNFHNLSLQLSYFRRFSTKISIRDCRDLHYLALHEIGECFSGNRRTESKATRRTESTKTYVSWNRFPKVYMLRERNKCYGTIKFVDINPDDYSLEENQGLDYKTIATITDVIYGVWAIYHLQSQDEVCNDRNSCKM